MATVTREQLQSIEWVGAGRTCPCCGGAPRFTNHAPDCWLAAALASPPAEAANTLKALRVAVMVAVSDPDAEWSKVRPRLAEALNASFKGAQAPPASDPPRLGCESPSRTATRS